MKEYFNDIDEYYNNKDEIKIKLKGINNITNMRFMFSGCKSLYSLSDISNGILPILLIWSHYLMNVIHL